jgi:hypothetical protein
MRLLAWRKGSLSSENLKRALRGQPFEYVGSPYDLVFGYFSKPELHKLSQRKSISKCSKAITHT